MDRAELEGLLNLREQMVPAGKANRPGTRIAPAFITIHNTSNANPGANAAAHARFVTNTGFYTLASGKKNQVSWHYTVDDREVVKHLPVNEKGFHAGPGNSLSVAIEVCMHAGIDQAAANLRAARLAALLAFDLGLGAGKLRTHKSWTGKACPALLLPGWVAFSKTVEDIRASVTGVAAMEAVAESLGQPDDAAMEAAADYDDAEIDHAAMEAAVMAEGVGAGG